MDRKKKLLEKKIKKEAKQEANADYANRLRKIRLGNSYVSAKAKGLYFLARCNMIAEQLNSGTITEMVDGRTKTKEYMNAEFLMSRISAIQALRQASFDKKDMIEIAKMTDEDIKEVEEYYFDKSVKRDDYGEEYRRERFAEFVQE